MSYYKVKSINFKRTTGQIFVTCADSGSRPLYYERFEYDPLDSRITDFAGKCKEFWMEVLAGNYQFLKSNRWYDAERKACEKMQQIVDYTDIGQYDFMCNTSFRSQLQKYVVKAYLVPLATKEEVTPDAAFEANALKILITGCFLWKNHLSLGLITKINFLTQLYYKRVRAIIMRTLFFYLIFLM